MHVHTVSTSTLSFCLVLTASIALAQVRTDIQQPGTQPGEVSNLESPDRCDNCHGGYDPAVEPAFNWRGSMMAHAGRDPIFWAALAIAQQDFPQSGDLCIRCHSPQGWVAGRSTPTNGSALMDKDADGVTCDLCHKLTRPDRTEHLGEQASPYLAFDQSTGQAYFGSGMYVLWGGSEKLGPYSDAQARHQVLQSRFHRSVDFCGTCHDISNPAVGDLAHNAGAQPDADPVTRSGVPGAPVEEKAAFNNLPYKYGIVERTFSEYRASLVDDTPVSTFGSLPVELQDGAFAAAYDAALLAGRNGDYRDGTTRYFSCQTCHVTPTVGVGCNKQGVPTRSDLPHHDMTGGNYWMPEAIAYLNTLGRLRLGGALDQIQLDALRAGKTRALRQLQLAASLSVADDTLHVVNLTGHKLISGYPEGRRMWLNIKWYDDADQLVREDGRYGPIDVLIDGQPRTVNTLVDLEDPNTKVYEAHYGMTQQWADQLLGLGYDTDMPLQFDRVTGDVALTLGDLAQMPTDAHEPTFHFVLNNTIVSDNRIPPYAMDYEQARRRNVLPVPDDQYNGLSGVYDYFDDFQLNPPMSAVRAEIALMYQPTSWEYVQFLYLANDESDPFLADQGEFLLDAWLNTGMADPVVMARTQWTGGGGGPVLVRPDSLVVRRGGAHTGSVEDLYESDNQYVVVQGIPQISPIAPAIIVEIAGTAPDPNLSQMTCIVESAASLPFIEQKAQLFNFDANTWEDVHTTQLTTSDGVVQVLIDVDPERFVNPSNGRIVTRLLYTPVRALISANWNIRLDQVIWYVQ